MDLVYAAVRYSAVRRLLVGEIGRPCTRYVCTYHTVHGGNLNLQTCMLDNCPLQHTSHHRRFSTPGETILQWHLIVHRRCQSLTAHPHPTRMLPICSCRCRSCLLRMRQLEIVSLFFVTSAGLDFCPPLHLHCPAPLYCVLYVPCMYCMYTALRCNPRFPPRITLFQSRSAYSLQYSTQYILYNSNHGGRRWTAWLVQITELSVLHG